MRRETFHADSQEYGKFRWPMGETESALSDLNLEMGKVPSASLKSVTRRNAHGTDMAMSRQSMGDTKHDSRVSDGEKNLTGDRVNKGGAANTRSIDPSKIGSIQEEAEHSTGPRTTVRTWIEEIAKDGDQETQTRYEDSCAGDTATEMGEHLPRAKRRPLDEDPKHKRAEGRNGEGSKSRRKQGQPVVGDGQPIVIGRTNVSDDDIKAN